MLLKFGASRMAILAAVLTMSACATETGSVVVPRYVDEKSEFTLDIGSAGKRFTPKVYDCGTYTRNDYTGERGNAHVVATCVRNRVRRRQPFRIYVCSSGIDFGTCRTTIVPGDGRMLVFYLEWSTDSDEFDAVECASYVVHPKTREMRVGTLSELEFLEGQSCQHRDELYELMINRKPADAAA